jgi:hypothetical protein
MIEITNIEYKERPLAVGDIGTLPYRCLLFSVRFPENAAVRFLVDQQAIRMLDAPAAKGAILRRNIEKIVIRMHSDTIFSVTCVIRIRQGLGNRVRSLFLAMLQGTSPVYTEEIGTSLEGFDARQVAEWIKSLGYDVELITFVPAHQPVTH